MYFFTVPDILKKIYGKNITWKMDPSEKSIWLTFDDGPNPAVTPWVLDILKKYDAKATFFCLGKNVESNPEIFKTIIREGHSVGNHSYSHKNGWCTHSNVYIADVEKCNQYVNAKFFRPPYGKLKPSQLQQLKQKYSIILWSLISGDFDINLKKEKCLDAVLNYTKSGTIIVFHDSLKAKEKLEFVLPKFLEHFKNLGYTFPAL